MDKVNKLRGMLGPSMTIPKDKMQAKELKPLAVPQEKRTLDTSKLRGLMPKVNKFKNTEGTPRTDKVPAGQAMPVFNEQRKQEYRKKIQDIIKKTTPGTRRLV